MLSYIIWNVDPEIFPIGPLSLRWYGLLFAGAFILSYMVARYMFMPREKAFNEKFIDEWLMYTMIGTVLGARLGHVFFYDWDSYKDNLIEILYVWKGGLASHGAGVGLLISTWFFARKYKVPYLWIMDLLGIVAALSGFCIRTGNLMNSEIYGVATNSDYGFVYVRDAVDKIKEDKTIYRVSFDKVPSDGMISGKYVPMNMTLRFEKRFMDTNRINESVKKINENIITGNKADFEIIYSGKKTQLISPQLKTPYYQVVVPVLGIPKHPTQIYEALFCLLLFGFLVLYYIKRKEKLVPGEVFGWFLVILFSFRFAIEYIKNIQVSVEATEALKRGQTLSVPFVLLGVALLIYVVIQKRKPRV